MSKKIGSKNAHKELTSKKIGEGVVKMVDHLNLIGGSIGDIGLYELNEKYLLDVDFRIRLNSILNTEISQIECTHSNQNTNENGGVSA